MSHIFEVTSSHFLRNDQFTQLFVNTSELSHCCLYRGTISTHVCIWKLWETDGFKWFPASLIFQDVVLFAARLSLLIHKQLNTHFLMRVRSR